MVPRCNRGTTGKTFFRQLKINIKPYQSAYREVWEDFVMKSANGTFLHQRSFMDYHGERFEDASVMVWDKEDLLAVFPAHRVGDQIFSHQGLSFGGWIFKNKLPKIQQISIIEKCLIYYNDMGISSIETTPIPEFYHQNRLTNQKIYEKNGAVLKDSKKVAIISLPTIVEDRGKRWGSKRAKSLGVKIEEKEVDTYFWNELLVPNHLNKLSFPPLHTWDQIRYLIKRHPNQITLYQAILEEKLLAGIVLFKHKKVIKIQYAVLSEYGKKFRAMDYLIHTLIENGNVEFIDFGTSIDPYTGQDKISLLEWKKSFGAEILPINTYQFYLS